MVDLELDYNVRKKNTVNPHYTMLLCSPKSVVYQKSCLSKGPSIHYVTQLRKGGGQPGLPQGKRGRV